MTYDKSDPRWNGWHSWWLNNWGAPDNPVVEQIKSVREYPDDSANHRQGGFQGQHAYRPVEMQVSFLQYADGSWTWSADLQGPRIRKDGSEGSSNVLEGWYSLDRDLAERWPAAPAPLRKFLRDRIPPGRPGGGCCARRPRSGWESASDGLHAAQGDRVEAEVRPWLGAGPGDQPAHALVGAGPGVRVHGRGVAPVPGPAARDEGLPAQLAGRASRARAGEVPCPSVQEPAGAARRGEIGPSPSEHDSADGECACCGGDAYRVKPGPWRHHYDGSTECDGVWRIRYDDPEEELPDDEEDQQ